MYLTFYISIGTSQDAVSPQICTSLNKYRLHEELSLSFYEHKSIYFIKIKTQIYANKDMVATIQSIHNFFFVCLSVCLTQLFSAPRRPTLANEVPKESL